jgi:photosystem II stability/assembly factor-like uncharacterized protein
MQALVKFGRDQLDTALLLVGFLLLVLSLLGAYLQRPSNASKPSPMPWLLQPPERNSFLKYPAIPGHLIGVHFDGSKRGWVVGSDGTILHTIDGGQSWRSQSGVTDEVLGSIYEPGDGKTLWAVGLNGTILHTIDGGKSWQSQSGGTDEVLDSIYGTGDGKTLWVVGSDGTILHTIDGGQSWQPQRSGTYSQLNSIYGTGDGKTLWVVGSDGTILHTIDGG